MFVECNDTTTQIDRIIVIYVKSYSIQILFDGQPGVTILILFWHF